MRKVKRYAEMVRAYNDAHTAYNDMVSACDHVYRPRTCTAGMSRDRRPHVCPVFVSLLALLYSTVQ